MKRWRAPRDPRTLLGLLGALILGGAALLGVQRLAQMMRGPLETWPITLASFGLALGVLASLLGLLLLVQYTLRAASLVFELDRNAIYVRRRDGRYTIPLHQITAVTIPESGSVPTPGLRFGRGRLAQTLLISTRQTQYRLAVQERDLFARELHDRRQFGIVQAQSEGWTWRRPALRAFWKAAAVRRLLVAILVLNLAAWALLTWRYALLPETIPVRFDPVGGTAGTRARLYTLLLPGAATAMWLVNLGLAMLLYRRARLAGELILLGALLVQAAILVAIWFIITSAS